MLNRKGCDWDAHAGVHECSLGREANSRATCRNRDGHVAGLRDASNMIKARCRSRGGKNGFCRRDLGEDLGRGKRRGGK